MVALPGLATYSPEQLNLARGLSRAFAHYERLLDRADLPVLHARRHRAWIECVLATYFQTASTADVCACWSQTADVILQDAWRDCGLDRQPAVLFALGKHGAFELNLSSDIDVLVVAEPVHALEIERGLRKFQNLISHPGEFGFCFRLDFDLRPGGKMGPRLTSPSQFQDYYWSQGETWERLAMVRLRAIAGDANLAEQIADLARRFSFRRFLDFTLLEDLKALRSQVHQKGFLRKDDELHLKLEVGGIRDIELFVHSLLVMNGGKIASLQTRSTSEAMQRLNERKLLSDADQRALLDSYWHFRHVENLVQSVEDRQTHAWTTSLPQLPGLPDRRALETRMHAVDKIVSGLLGAVDLDSVRLPASEAAQRAWLQDLGFSEGAIAGAWDAVIKATALSYKNDRDERARQEFLFTFVSELAHQPDRELGLGLLADFVKATRAKATFFSMLLRSPGLIRDLARLFCLSPYLGHILASRPELLDHFILQVDEAWASDLEALLQQMGERKLLTELWSASQYLADGDLGGLSARVTETADAIAAQLLLVLRAEFNSEVEILALGKWGGRELGLRSDLDFVFVTPRAPTDADFKVARRFISRLTDPSRGGQLYDVDLRLRPSGQSGHLLVAQDKLHEYWRDRAQAWERQAYLRARPLNPKLVVDKSLVVKRALSSDDLAELKRIREKLLQPLTSERMDLKYVPGGLLDVEFVCQTAVLAHGLIGAPESTEQMIHFLAQHRAEWTPAAESLISAYSEIRRFEQALQLASAHRVSDIRPTHPAFTKAASLVGLTPESAWARLTTLTTETRTRLNPLDPTGLTL